MSWGVPLMVAAALLALARVYVGIHYPADVVASMLLGLLVARAVLLVGEPLERVTLLVEARLPGWLQ